MFSGSSNSQNTPITPITSKTDSKYFFYNIYIYSFDTPFYTYTPKDYKPVEQTSKPMSFFGIVTGSFSQVLLSKSQLKTPTKSASISTITSPSSTPRSSICSITSPNTSILSVESPITSQKYKEYDEIQTDRRLLNSVRIISKFKLDPIILLSSQCCINSGIGDSDSISFSMDRINYNNSLTYYIYPNNRISDEEYNKIKQFNQSIKYN